MLVFQSQADMKYYGWDELMCYKNISLENLLFRALRNHFGIWYEKKDAELTESQQIYLLNYWREKINKNDDVALLEDFFLFCFI